jgi:hypothetical protein
VSNVGRHALRRLPLAPTRVGVTTAVAASAMGVMIAAVVAANCGGTRAVPAPVPKRAVTPVDTANAVPSVSDLGGLRGSGSLTRVPAPRGAVPLVLTAADHSDCPAAAAACVDLTRHITCDVLIDTGHGDPLVAGPQRELVGEVGAGRIA